MEKVSFCILKNSKGEFLLQKKTFNYIGGNWVLFGGSIEEGEKPIDAVKREIYEELEIKINPKKIFEGIAKEGEKNSEVFVFEDSIELKDISKLKEGAGFAFFNIKELDKIEIYYNSKFAIDKYLKNCN